MRFRHAALAIFGLALAARLAHLLALRHSAPFFDVLMGDARGYHEWAQRIAAGDWLGRDVFYQAPMYPYLLGVVYALGGDPLVARLVQAIAGAASCVLIADAGRRLFTPRAGIIAGGILALYAPSIFLDGLIQKSTLDLLLLGLLLWLVAGIIVAPPERSTRVRWIALGAVAGGLVLTRENALLLVPVLLAWAVVRGRPPLRRGLAAAALLGGATAVVLLPVAVRNAVVGGELHLTTSQLGPNFFIGNHAAATGIYQPLRPHRADFSVERLDAEELAEEATGRTLTPAEVSSYWTRRALDDIGADPGRWIGLLVTKTALAFNATEIADTEDQYLYADHSPVLRVTGLVAHFGVLVPLALLGAWLAWPRRGTHWPLYVLPAVYLAGLVLFYIFARYRFPLVPFLVLFAGAGLDALPASIRERRWSLVLVVSLGAAALFCNWPLGFRAPMRTMMHYNLGLAYRDAGRDDDAIAALEQAVALNPRLEIAHEKLGVLHAARGDLAAAARHYVAAIEANPASATAHHNLGTVYARLGNLDHAAERFREAVRLDPALAEAHTALASVLLVQEDLAGSAQHYLLAIAHDPDGFEAHHNLAALRERQGRDDDALTHYEHAVRIRPDSPVARGNLERLRRARGGDR